MEPIAWVFFNPYSRHPPASRLKKARMLLPVGARYNLSALFYRSSTHFEAQFCPNFSPHLGGQHFFLRIVPPTSGDNICFSGLFPSHRGTTFPSQDCSPQCGGQHLQFRTTSPTSGDYFFTLKRLSKSRVDKKLIL